MLRQANFNDIPAIVELTLESVANNPWPVAPSRRIIRQYARQSISQGAAWVSDIGGVQGVVAAVKHPSVWFMESQVTLLVFYCRKVGDGVKLLKQFAEWVKSQPDVAVATVSLEPTMGDKYARIFRKLGFNQPSPTLSFVRGMP